MFLRERRLKLLVLMIGIDMGERCFKDCVNLETVEAPGGIFFGRSENF